LGFAVSGERASCCSKDKVGGVNKDNDRVGRERKDKHLWGEVADEGGDEDGRRKRIKLGMSEDKTVGDPGQPIAETLFLFPV